MDEGKQKALKTAFKIILTGMTEQIDIRQPISPNVLEYLIDKNVRTLMREVTIRSRIA